MDNDSPYAAPRSDVGDAMADDDTLLGAFLGPKNADYYLERFRAFDAGAGSLTWHWPAFFVTWGWLAYRKMWAWFFGYWLLFPVVVVFLSMPIAAVSEILSVAFYLACFFVLPPLIANRLYYRHALKKTEQARRGASTPGAQALEAARLGGTSPIAFVIVPVAIIVFVGILAAISIPAYHDYTLRAQVSEGLSLAGQAKAAVSVHYEEVGTLPAGNEDAGLPPPESISGTYVESVAVNNGQILVTYGNEVSGVLDDAVLMLSPYDGPAGLEWECESSEIRDRYLPSACRR